MADPNSSPPFSFSCHPFSAVFWYCFQLFSLVDVKRGKSLLIAVRSLDFLFSSPLFACPLLRLHQLFFYNIVSLYQFIYLFCLFWFYFLRFLFALHLICYTFFLRFIFFYTHFALYVTYSYVRVDTHSYINNMHVHR